MLSTFLPREAMQKHVAESVGPFIPLKPSRNIVGKDIKYKEDLYTDSLILNISVPYKSNSHLQNAFSAQFSDNIKTPLIGLLNRTKNWDIATSQYLRYWGGYTVPVRILLSVASYQKILVVNVIFFAILLTVIGLLLFRRFNLWIALSFIISLFIVGFAAVPFALQYVGVFYITCFALIFELLFSRITAVENFAPELFVVIGTVTVWIDFLTVPLVTLGLPLLVAFLLSENSKIRLLVFSSLAWVMSFATFWLMRWALAGAMYPQANIKSSVSEGLAFRLGKTEGMAHKLSAVAKNVAMILAYPATGKDDHLGNRAYIGASVLVLIAIALLFAWLAKKCKPSFREILPFVLVGLYPFAWYLVVSNHSYIHAYFTYRLLVISLFAAACIAYCIMSNGQKATSNNGKM